MSRIKILPEILSNKIAAGEVVERPASVVKELVENALDAGSTRIIIEVEKGGRSLIRISDNGMGMDYDDALLAIERYATSKIYKDEDLFSIHTLGFRGEALPSIASVSKFTMETRPAAGGDLSGTKIEIHGGKLKKVSEAGMPPGTLISVKQLFFNTPARRKFMKTINTEMSHIGDIIASIALGWHKVQFKLIHNNKLIKNWPEMQTPFDRVVDVLGKNFKNDFYKTEYKTEYISVLGWISRPQITRKTSRGIYVYVNGRCVKDRAVQHAIFSGYSSRLMKGQFPLAVLFINVPPDQVDVNVHPTKNEVRFFSQQNIHKLIVQTISETLNKQDQPILNSVKNPDIPVYEKPMKKPEYLEERSKPRLAEPESKYIPSEKSYYNPEQQLKNQLNGQKPEISLNQNNIWEKRFFSDLRVIGQYQGTYILCESNSGLILIDQHAAHERILFEKLKNQPFNNNNAQKLLISETFDLNYQEAAVLENLIDDFKKIGFEIEPFGGNTFAVKSIPVILKDKPAAPLIVEIIETIAELGNSANIEKALDKCLILMACHGAIRANQSLSTNQMYALLNQLDKCNNPSNCPHGRPTWIKWTKQFLEKSFHRIV